MSPLRTSPRLAEKAKTASLALRLRDNSYAVPAKTEKEISSSTLTNNTKKVSKAKVTKTKNKQIRPKTTRKKRSVKNTPLPDEFEYGCPPGYITVFGGFSAFSLRGNRYYVPKNTPMDVIRRIEFGKISPEPVPRRLVVLYLDVGLILTIISSVRRKWAAGKLVEREHEGKNDSDNKNSGRDAA